MHSRHALKPMTGEQALEAVRKPGGILVDRGVEHKIVRFVSAANEAEPQPDRPTEEDFQQLQVQPALLSLVKRFIATGGNDKSVRRWTLPQGGEVRVLDGYGRGYCWRCRLSSSIRRITAGAATAKQLAAGGRATGKKRDSA